MAVHMFSYIRQTVVLALLSLLWSAPSVLAATYHVSKTGSGSCAAAAAPGCTGGTCARATIENGIACMGGGDTLLVHGGTYPMDCLSDTSQFTDAPIPAGTASQPTRIQAAGDGAVWLTTPSLCPADEAASGAISLNRDSPSYLVFDGINVDGLGVSRWAIGVSSQYNVFKNMTVKNVHRGCIVSFVGANESVSAGNNQYLNVTLSGCGTNPQPGLGAVGFYITSWNNVIDGCDITGVASDDSNHAMQFTNETLQPVQQNTVKNCRIHDGNMFMGILANTGNTFYNNIFSNIQNGMDIRGGNIYNNIFFTSNIGIQVKNAGHVIRNNILMGNSSPINDGDGGGWSGTFSNNACNTSSGTFGICTHVMNANDIFVNAAGGDFHHKPTSPALNIGTTIGAVATDIEGHTRPQAGAYDLGAYEFTTGVPPVATALQFSVHPATTAPGAAIFPAVTVRVLDQTGAHLPTATVTITIAFGANPTGATLGGTKVVSTAGTGTAIFPTLTVNNPGTGYTLLATAPGLPSDTSSAFTVAVPPPPPAAYIAHGFVPASAVVNQVLSPPVTVEIRDAAHAIVPTATNSVTIALEQNPAGGTLTGTLVRNAVAGVATFNDLKVNTVGTGYTFRATTTGLPDNTDQSDFFAITASAPPVLPAPLIMVDQFGYLPTMTKVAVLANPITGFNAADAYTPGGTLTVKTSPGDSTVFTAAPTAWNAGATHTQSGDQLWWFDFSSVTTPGNYYIHDATNGLQSDVFAISGSVYNAVLTAAQRMFYYQRSGFAKAAPYTDAKWADGAAFLGTGQDTQARSVVDQGNAGTARDLRGGWFDAGDYNKYTVWGAQVVSDLLTAYQQAPSVWTDATNIPESGNGLPDIVDEAKWELDWLLRMQTATGTGAVLSKVSVLLPEATSPPSADTRPRYWGAASTAATAASAAAFAHGSLVFTALGQTTYAATLSTAAQNAWTWAAANPNVDYPNTGFGTANPDPCGHGCPYGQLMERLRAAIYLYALTGTATYKTFVDANYTAAHALEWGYWYYSEPYTQDALLYYAALAGATTFVKNAIQAAALSSIASAEFVSAWTGNVDGYRAYLKDADYTWGSNRNKGYTGALYTNLIAYGLNSAQHATYRTIAEAYVHSLHGVNPMGLAYLTAMGGLGAERSANEMYHSWFADGTVWDNAQTSPNGLPPGFLTGGPNPGYSGNQTPPLGQPVQKSYRDWNSGIAAEQSWAITEPAIYYQSAYLRLLSQLVPVPTGVPTSLGFGVQPASTVSGAAITPAVTVRVLDAGSQVVTASTLPVTVALAVNPAGGTLACGPATCTKNAVAGVATFDTLSIATVGTGYALGATTTGGVTAAQSDVFAITAVPVAPTDLVITTLSTGHFLAR